MEDKIAVRWFGHSCFELSANGYQIVLDPYKNGKVPGLKPLKLTADEVYTSHGHDDHNNIEAVELKKVKIPSPFEVTQIECAHDSAGGALRGKTLIHIVRFRDMRIAHFGDIGEIPAEDTLEILKNLDAALIPVGGYYTIDAHQAKCLVDRISPRVVIPMHYRKDGFGFPNIDTPDEFLRLFDHVILYDKDVMELSKYTERQIAVLQPLNRFTNIVDRLP